MIITVINVLWFKMHAVSNGVHCYPAPTALNTYNNLGLTENLEAKLQMPSCRITLTAYFHINYHWNSLQIIVQVNMKMSTLATKENNCYSTCVTTVFSQNLLIEDYIIRVQPTVQPSLIISQTVNTIIMEIQTY